MNLTIEGTSLIDIEEKIIEMAAEIQDRRAILREGCSCETRPLTTGEAARCRGPFVMCKTRMVRLGMTTVPAFAGPTPPEQHAA